MNINLQKILEELQQGRFWGSIEVQLQDGVPMLFKKTETVKIHQGNTHGNPDRKF